MKKVLFVSVCMMAMMMITQQSFALNLITNGSFEEGNYTGGAWNRLQAGNTSLTGWTIGGNGVDWHNHQQFTSLFDGDKVIDFNLDGGTFGSISQDFATTPGMSYQLTFALAGPGKEFGFPDAREVKVTLAGADYILSQPASSHTNMVWDIKTILFQAVDTTTRLTFANTNSAGFWGPVIDDVSVVSAVPEPSTMLMLGFGIIGLVGMGRKKLGM